MTPKVKIGEAYQPARRIHRGAGSYSAYRPHTGHLSDINVNRWNDPIDRALPVICAIGIVCLVVMLIRGIL